MLMDFARERAMMMARMIEGGKTYEEAGAYFGITKQRVHQILKKHELVQDNPEWIPMTSAVKIPPLKRRAKYPWRMMEIGDSFLVPKEAERFMRTHASSTGKRLGRRFSCRRTPSGSMRVWRVE